jgi:hypothetical protein
MRRSRLNLRDREPQLSQIPLVLVTDCKSLYDTLVGVGKRPSEARLVLDIDALKEFSNVSFRWVNTKQMIADPLTKKSASVKHLLWVLQYNEWMYQHDPNLAQKIDETKQRLRLARRAAWEERRGGEAANAAEEAEVDEGLVERRALAAMRLWQRVRDQFDFEDPRDTWTTDDEVWRRLASIAGQKLRRVAAVRVHLRPRRQLLTLSAVQPDQRPENTTGVLTLATDGSLDWTPHGRQATKWPKQWTGFSIFLLPAVARTTQPAQPSAAQ